MAGTADKSGRKLFLQQMQVRLRRLMHEGFREFLISVGLAALAAIMISIYVRDKVALEQAIRDETVSIVGTRQEPVDSAKELGLIATALAKVNEMPDAVNWECPADEPNCSLFERLPGELTQAADADITNAAASHLDKGDWSRGGGDIDNLTPRRQNPEDLSWPELASGRFCGIGTEHTFLMVPSQMSAPDTPYFTPRIAAAADVSQVLIQHLIRHLKEFRENPEYAKLTKSLVQAYFISPDSLLRIWNPVHPDLCEGFPKTRLWAAKHYFVEFWEGERKDHFSTSAYIDYGGNGLVRTSCHAVELRHQKDENALLAGYPRGHFLGIFCMDFKLPDEQVDRMRHQLFFETADVTFPVEGNYDVDQLSVRLVSPAERAAAADERQREPEPAATAQPVVASTAPVATRSAETVVPRAPPNAEDVAYGMQESSIDVAEVRKLIYQRLQSIDALTRTREILRVSYRDKPAFLLPLGISGKQFEALFFYPRSPRLPLQDNIWGVLGFLCAGAAIASLIINSRFHSQIADLRTHMSLLRSLQVGVVKAEPGYEITECNDRAEELCGRKLPKPGVKLSPPINFFDMFDLFAQEGETGYKEIFMEDIQRARHSGQASSYYARLRTDEVPKWLFVQATPIMEPERIRIPGTKAFRFRQRKMWQMVFHGAFATITDTCKDRVDALNAQFQTRGRG